MPSPCSILGSDMSHDGILRLRETALLSLVLACAIPAQRIGVLDFTSSASPPSLTFLSKTLPSALTEPLASQPGIAVVERERLDRLAQERGLQLSGLVEMSDSDRAILPADAFVIGQYAGTLENLTVQLHVVECGTGTLKGAFSRNGPLQEILAGMPALASQIALSLRGESWGRVTVESEPSGALVHLDGRLLGRTPLIDQRVAAGRHELTLEHEHRVAWKDSFVVEPSGTLSRKVELAVDHDPTGFWFGGGGRMQGLTMDFSDPVGPEFSGYITVVGRGRRWGLEGTYAPPVTHAYLVEYDVPWGTRSSERTFEIEMARLVVLYDVVQSGRWNAHLGLGAAMVNCKSTPYALDDKQTSREHQLLGGTVSGGIRFELARWMEIVVEGQGFASPDDIDVIDVTSRDLFETHTDTRKLSLQLWNAQIAARFRFP